MATPQTNLRVRISADLADIKSGLLALRKDLDGVKQGAREALRADNNQFVAGLKQVRAQIGALVASYASLQGIQAFARISDQANQLSGRLKLATKDVQSFNAAQRDTFAIAQRNQVSLATTVDLYSRLSRSTDRLGLGQQKQSALTESILQAGRLSFASDEGLNAAIVQLGQGLSSGQLRGEELNSVLEQTPRLAQAIQDGLRELGVKGADDLRKLAKEGQLTPEVIVEAILTQQQRLAEEAKKIPPTIAGAFTELSNAVLKFVQDSDEANSGAQTIIGFLRAIAENLPSIISLLVTATKIAAAYFLVFRAAPAAIGLAMGALKLYKDQVIATNLAQTLGIKTATSWASRLKAAAGVAFSAFVGWEIGSYLREEFLEVELAGIAFVNNLLIGFERARLAAVVAGEGIKAAFKGAFNLLRDNLATGLSNYASAIEAVDVFGLNGATSKKLRDFADTVRSSGSAWDEFKAKAEAAALATEDRVEAIRRDFDALAGAAIERKLLGSTENGGSGQGGGSGGDTQSKARAAADSLELLKDATERALRQLEQAYADGELSMAQYFARKAELETRAVDIALQVAHAELRSAESVEAQGKALTTIIKLQRDRAEIGPRVAREQAAAEGALADELQNLGIRMLELEGNTEAAAAIRLGQQFSALRERLVLEGNKLGVELIDRVFNAELAKQRLDSISSRASAAMAAIRSETDYLNSQVELGGMSPVDAERELQRVREDTLTQLRTLRAEAEAAYNQAPTPETLAVLRELDTQILQITESQKRFKNEAKQGAIDALTGFFTDLATSAKSFKDAFKDMVLNFIQGLARMASEVLAKQIIFSLFNAFGGGGGSFMKAGGTPLKGIGVKHSGGAPGQGTQRLIPRSTFAAYWGQAPRFHEGVNLKAGEIPAILQEGERVLSRAENSRYSEGGRPAPGYRIYNIQDPNFVPDAMGGPDGERVVMNHIGRNPGQVRQLLGLD